MRTFEEDELCLIGYSVLKKRNAPSQRLLKKVPKTSEFLKAGLKEVEQAKRLGISVVFFEDPEYPEALRHIKDPPAFLYVKGRLLGSRATVALVGSRKATPYGLKIAFEWGRKLAEAGLGVVSGLALGIDAEAHRGALTAKGYTVAVLGSGLNFVYPYQNRPLASKIVAQGGALISEFPLNSKPERWHFPIRNRVIAGMCKGVVVVEASSKSGSLITAAIAAEEGREVFAVPGSIFSPNSEGIHRLIKEGAYPVTSPEEVLEVLGIESKDSESKPEEDALSEVEERVLELVPFYPVHFDELLERSKVSVSELSETLLNLEVKGRVVCLPGGFYQRT